VSRRCRKTWYGKATRPSRGFYVDIPLVGQIEVQRRRKLKDGRVKLKLRLMGVSVNICGICLMQFKDKEMGALTPKCQHQ
jgi:hypothetical protein